MTTDADRDALQQMLGFEMELDDTSLGAFVHTRHSALSEVFSRIGLVPHQSTLLDIGCGDGRAAVLAGEQFHCAAVGGIDVDWSVIESFQRRWNAVLAKRVGVVGEPSSAMPNDDSNKTSTPSSSPTSGTSQEGVPPLCVCIAGDALKWAAQDRLFYTMEEQAALSRAEAVVTNALVPPASDAPMYLPRPTHIYLYILQHMLYKLVPLMKRIRQEIPGIVIVSAFPFRVRPSVLAARRREAERKKSTTTKEEATSLSGKEGTIEEQEQDGEEEYLDVDPAEIYLDTQGKLEFRIYK